MFGAQAYNQPNQGNQNNMSLFGQGSPQQQGLFGINPSNNGFAQSMSLGGPPGMFSPPQGLFSAPSGSSDGEASSQNQSNNNMSATFGPADRQRQSEQKKNYSSAILGSENGYFGGGLQENSNQQNEPNPNISNRLFNKNAGLPIIPFNVPTLFGNNSGNGSHIFEQSSQELKNQDDRTGIDRKSILVEKQKEEDGSSHCLYCPKKYSELNKMICEECVSSRYSKRDLRIRLNQIEEKQKVDQEELKRLRRQTVFLEKEKYEKQITHQNDINELKAQLGLEATHNSGLIEEITKLKDIVKFNSKFREECRLITEENQEGWGKVYLWAEKFNTLMNKLLPKVQTEANEINKILIKEEEYIIFSVQDKLSKIPKDIMEILESIQEERKTELGCMKQAQTQVLSVLESQKIAFEKCDIAFPAITMALAVKPFTNDIAKIEEGISELENMKNELALLAIFSVEEGKGPEKSE